MATEPIERQPDKFDAASDLEILQRNAAIAKIQRSLVETHPDFDGENCVDCELEIPEARLKMCRVRCVSCQTDLEYSNRTRRN